jgi:Flp pilus assembly protein TadB
VCVCVCVLHHPLLCLVFVSMCRSETRVVSVDWYTADVSFTYGAVVAKMICVGYILLRLTRKKKKKKEMKQCTDTVDDDIVVRSVTEGRRSTPSASERTASLALPPAVRAKGKQVHTRIHKATNGKTRVA